MKTQRLTLLVNGTQHALQATHEISLLEALREHLGLTGTKCGCNAGVCGSCTVLIDGAPRSACQIRAADVGAAPITTIEGLARPDETLHPIQQAFIDAGAIQCGFCTPGMVLAAAALLARVPHPSRVEIRSALTPHLCRCTGYRQIFEAIELATQRMHAPDLR
jgi:aerobic-type carbon monoxide dehydrogenase small subunit (CoxS/CutS family)